MLRENFRFTKQSRARFPVVIPYPLAPALFSLPASLRAALFRRQIEIKMEI